MNLCYPFITTPLPYEYDALEPWIDRETMYLHHTKHLQAVFIIIGSFSMVWPLQSSPALLLLFLP